MFRQSEGFGSMGSRPFSRPNPIGLPGHSSTGPGDSPGAADPELTGFGFDRDITDSGVRNRRVGTG